MVICCDSGIEAKNIALGAGAVGYLIKPLNQYELMVNLDAVARLTHGRRLATILVGNLAVDLSRNYPTVGETRLELTANEFRGIEFLAPQKSAVLSKDAYLSHLHGDIDQPEPEIINVFTCKLQRKFIGNGAECLSVDTV